MRIQTVIVLLWWFVATVQAAPLKRSDRFESPSAFSTALQALVPASDQGEIGSLFSVKEPGQPEDPKTGSQTWAKGIDFCEVLTPETPDADNATEWALVWAKTKVPTDGNDSVAAAVFLPLVTNLRIGNALCLRILYVRGVNFLIRKKS